MKTIKNGSYFDGGVWDTGKAPTETDNISIEHDLTFDRNIVKRAGVLSGRKGSLQPVGFKETQFVGTIDDPNNHDGLIASDVGIWMLGTSQLDLQGTPKQSWTNLTGSVLKGVSIIGVKSAAGWLVGDRIVVYPTDKPGENTMNWNDATNTPEDTFLPRFEKKTIKSISGNTITLDSPLEYDHKQVSNFPPAEVVNNTRTFKIFGTPSGRSHILIKSSKPQVIDNIEMFNMGPRGGGQRPGPILGRYPIHFHHCGDGSRGSRVTNNAVHDIGNRGIVVHGSHGVTVENNNVTFFMNNGYWYDPGHVTNTIRYIRNICGGVVYDGGHAGNSEGFMIGQGDENEFDGNVAVYCKLGPAGVGGAFSWNADNEGIPIFKNNLSHSNSTGLFVWQNTGHFHLLIGHQSYNEDCGMFWGAYINSYLLFNCSFYNSFITHKATPGSNAPMYEKCTFDGAGNLNHLIEVLSSAVPAGIPIGFRECIFRDYKDSAVLMNTIVHDEGVVTQKSVDFILSSFTGKMWKFASTSIFGSYFRCQPPQGQATRFDQQGTFNIAPFAPYRYGTGTGLTGEYYNGNNFQTFRFKRVDSMIKFQGWRKDPKNSPTGVHYLINGEVFSARWVGKAEAHYSEDHTFWLESWGGIRLWVKGILILDLWQEFNERVLRPSKPIALTAGEQADFKMEHFNENGDMGCMLYWKSKSMNENKLVPMSQLYPTGGIAPPPPPVFKSVRKTKDFTRNNCPAGQTGEVYTYSVDAGQFESAISQADADAKADADIVAKGQSQANQFGTCKIIIMPGPCEEFKWQDYLAMHKDLRDAGINTEAKALSHYNTWGRVKEKRRANFDCMDETLTQDPGTWPKVTPTRILKSTIKVYSDGSIEVT